MSADEPGTSFEYDAFISYSRADRAFVEKLELALEEFVPPLDLPVPQRRLNVFRDEADMTGTDYYRAVDTHVQQSNKLIVVCSPSARASRYVDDEVRRFVAVRGADHIVPVLAAGVPNNEARAGQDSLKAFPEALCEALEMPLAVSFLHYAAETDAINDGAFKSAWYTLLANLYGISRGEIEQRDAVKRARDRATQARELAAAGLHALQADPELALLLALHAVSTTYAADATVVREAEELLHRAVETFQRFRRAPVRTLAGHEGAVWSVRYSPDGSKLATVSEDGAWMLWDAATGERLRVVTGFISHPMAPGVLIEAPSAPVKAAAFSPDGSRLLTAQMDDRAKLWEVESGRGLGSLYLAGPVWDVAYSPDGARVATASLDGMAKIWDVNTGDAVQELPVAAESLMLRGEIAPVVGVAFSPDGQKLATAAKFGDVRVWSVASGAVLASLHGHAEVVHDARFSPDGTRIATASEDGTWRLWDAATGDSLHTEPATGAQPGSGAVYAVAFSPDGSRLATASRDKTAALWDAATGRRLFTLAGHRGGVWGVDFSPDGQRVATASYDKTAKIWDASPHEELLRHLLGHEDTVAALAFSPDGARLLTGSWDKTARLWELATGREVLRIAGQTGTVHGVAFHPDGRSFATANGDTTAKIWDAASGHETAVLEGHAKDVLSVAYSPDGGRLATASDDGTAKVWDLSSGRELYTLRSAHQRLVGVAWSGDGALLATAATDHEWATPVPGNSTAKIWDAATGEELRTLSGHSHPLMGIAFSPRGGIVATASHDHTARLWDARSGREAATLAGHTSRLTSIAISADGARVATGSLDKTVKVWRTSAVAEPLSLVGQTDAVWSVAFSPDGKRLAAGGKDRTVVVYTLDVESLMSLVKERLVRELSAEECQKYFGAAVCPPLA